MADSERSMEPAFGELIEKLAARANGARLTLGDAQSAFEALDAELREQAEQEGRIYEGADGAQFLDELARAGVDLQDEGDLDEASLEKAVDQAVRYAAAEGGLDAASQWRREVGNHRILSREEERELADRYRFHKRTEDAHRAALGRLEKRLTSRTARYAELEAEAAGQREIIAMLTGDAELGDVGELLAEPQARVAALEAEMAELRSAIAELEVERASIEADIEAANRAAREVEERFISHNYRLVLKYANKFWERARHRCDYMDLVSPGNLGMVEAFRKFDPTRGFKFSTFATWHIRQKISQWLREQAPSGPRIPTYRQRDWIAIDYQRNLFFQRNGRQPTLEEIAGLVGKSTDIVLEILRAEAISNSASLDRPISDDDGAGTLGDLLEDQNAVNPERVVELRALGSGLAEIMERTLTPREYRVIQARFGLWDSGRKLTLEKVGEMMNITRERVRQIEARALAKMRQDPLARELKGVDESESAWEEAGEAVA